MDIFEALGYKLLAASALTNVTSTRIYHGLRPAGSAPCINYFEVGYAPLHNGVLEMARYQVSCRASTPKVAQNLAREVCVLLHNFQGGTGSTGTFAVQRVSIEGKLLIPEPETELFHVPVDVVFVYDDSTVS
jgi:hypothetical protein